MILVFNASPVIVLAKAGLLEAFAALGNPTVSEKTLADVRARAGE